MISNPNSAYFTSDQVSSLFTASRAKERGALAIAMFAGLGPKRIDELTPTCINIKEKYILIRSRIAGKRIFSLHTGEEGGLFPGLPSVLWAWLEEYPFQRISWPALQSRLAAAVDGTWIHDGCRRTSATYYVTLHGIAAAIDCGLIAESRFSRGPRRLVGCAKRQEAEDFYSISPQAIGPAAT